MPKVSKVFLAFGIAVFAFLILAQRAVATTNISATTTDHWAWNDIIGWIDFYNTTSVNVFSNRLEGYASSSAGDISLDCHTTRNGDICAQSNYQVTNDGGGNLSKWAWNDQYGWISFDCNNSSCPPNYQVHINGNTGDFGGDGVSYAWNDTVGWISFNCADPSICGTSQYKVNSSWLATSTTGTVDSTTYDTGVAAGAQLNSVLWHGNLPASTVVKFQFATGNSTSGSWTTNFVGTDGTVNTYYTTGRDLSLKLNYNYHNNFRYFRYRALMLSNQSSTVSPRIDDVIVNWSP